MLVRWADNSEMRSSELLTQRGALMKKFNRILAPTDFSAYSDEGLRFAIDLAELFGSELTVLNVLRPDEIKQRQAMPLPSGYLDTIYRETKQKARDHFDEMMKERRHDLEVRFEVASGDPFVEIIRKAREQQSDMIVLATHGRTGLKHVLLGSVAEKVVRSADCPVLSIKPSGHKFELP